MIYCREALKQSATDPTTGLIDVSILATGQSSETRKKRQQLAAALKVTTNLFRIVTKRVLFNR
jgi:DNA replicative helicase MCM subunit Mcm2 (Cdc46/Mcm family)